MKAIQIEASKSRRKSLEDKPMTTGELDKETYRRIIQDYFRTFGTGDFSNVKFSFRHRVSQPIQIFSCLCFDDCPPGDATSRAST